LVAVADAGSLREAVEQYRDPVAPGDAARVESSA
jgi:hypothetical protein